MTGKHLKPVILNENHDIYAIPNTHLAMSMPQGDGYAEGLTEDYSNGCALPRRTIPVERLYTTRGIEELNFLVEADSQVVLSIPSHSLLSVESTLAVSSSINARDARPYWSALRY